MIIIDIIDIIDITWIRSERVKIRHLKIYIIELISSICWYISEMQPFFNVITRPTMSMRLSQR